MKEKLQRLGLDLLAVAILALIASPFYWAWRGDAQLESRIAKVEAVNRAQAKNLKEQKAALEQHAQAIMTIAQKVGLASAPPAPAKAKSPEKRK